MPEAGRTSISVQDEEFERIRAIKPGWMSWGQFLMHAAEAWQEKEGES